MVEDHIFPGEGHRLIRGTLGVTGARTGMFKTHIFWRADGERRGRAVPARLLRRFTLWRRILRHFGWYL